MKIAIGLVCDLVSLFLSLRHRDQHPRIGLGSFCAAHARSIPVDCGGFQVSGVEAVSFICSCGRFLFWCRLFDAAKLALIGMTVVDALLDFRRRWQGPAAPMESPEDDADDGQVVLHLERRRNRPRAALALEGRDARRAARSANAAQSDAIARHSARTDSAP